jgi:hypothetical protein
MRRCSPWILGSRRGLDMAEGFVCWKCGAAIADQPIPLARIAVCSACRADLHVCRLCEFYDSRVAKGCREPVAEDVLDKERANFCGYFQIKLNAYGVAGESISRSARSQLEALFGGGPKETEEGDKDKADLRSEDAARERLERLFGGAGKDER